MENRTAILRRRRKVRGTTVWDCSIALEESRLGRVCKGSKNKVRREKQYKECNEE